ncbi:MAG: methyltransferase domain-containing protein [Ruminococcus sp.]|nr:methyltransferase domain-containing protein [Ruminococcus sp.]
MNIDENRIADLEMYLTRMQRSVLDKMFFIDKVFEPFENIVDFGCANGELIKALRSMCSEYRYIGYDISEEMIEAAKQNVPEASFYTDWNAIDIPFEKSLINVSSVIHEVWSYCSREDIEEFRERLFGSGFKYIAIRDMMFSDAQDRPADPAQLEAVKRSGYSELLESFESIWGRVTTQKQLVHFLLKYKYTNNWEREVRENYFPVSVEEMLGMIPDGYRISYFEPFTLPYLSWQLRKDTGIELKENTHIKIILERR